MYIGLSTISRIVCCLARLHGELCVKEGRCMTLAQSHCTVPRAEYAARGNLVSQQQQHDMGTGAGRPVVYAPPMHTILDSNGACGRTLASYDA